jgi:hypothetical protein
VPQVQALDVAVAAGSLGDQYGKFTGRYDILFRGFSQEVDMLFSLLVSHDRRPFASMIITLQAETEGAPPKRQPAFWRS